MADKLNIFVKEDKSVNKMCSDVNRTCSQHLKNKHADDHFLFELWTCKSTVRQSRLTTNGNSNTFAKHHQVFFPISFQKIRVQASRKSAHTTFPWQWHFFSGIFINKLDFSTNVALIKANTIQSQSALIFSQHWQFVDHVQLCESKKNLPGWHMLKMISTFFHRSKQLRCGDFKGTPNSWGCANSHLPIFAQCSNFFCCFVIHVACGWKAITETCGLTTLRSCMHQGSPKEANLCVSQNRGTQHDNMNTHWPKSRSDLANDFFILIQAMLQQDAAMELCEQSWCRHGQDLSISVPHR